MAKKKSEVRPRKNIPNIAMTKEPDYNHNGDDLHVDPEAPPIEAGGLEAAPRNWRVARALDTLLTQINLLAPHRNKDSDGGIGDAAHASRTSDHNPWVIDDGVGIVTARDFTHDPDNGCDAGVLADRLRTARDPRIKYIIWNRRICNEAPMGAQPAWAWRPYTGPSPHDHHVHLSVKSEKALYDSTTAWAIGSIDRAMSPTPVAAMIVPDAASHDALIAELDAATQSLLGLSPLIERLTHLQDSADAAVASKAGELLARYGQLSRLDLARQPPTEDGAAASIIQPSPPAPLPPFTGKTFPDLKARYEALYAGSQVRPEWASQVAWHRKKLIEYRARYDPVAAATGVPWWFIGIVHALEGSFNFATHLHNGDPLTARTVQVPPNRPAIWNPPSDWASSAIDALTYEGVAHQTDWTVARALYRFEGYNGYSYYERRINSPYLWSFSNQYSKGKFVADHVYNADAVSKQCGAAVMLKALVTAGDVTV